MGNSCKKGISSMSSIAMFDYCRLFVPVDFSTSSMRCLRGSQTRTPTFGQELELGQVEPKISVLDYLKGMKYSLGQGPFHFFAQILKGRNGRKQ